MGRSELLLPGGLCQPDARKSGPRGEHLIVEPEQDRELQAVLAWLHLNGADVKLREAVDEAIRYVLDGARTWRFDLTSPEVDSDERASVGTKLQYHVIEKLGLEKEPPLDTTIVGLPVEIKGTVRGNWMIPREGQCEITLMIQIDASGHRFRAFLIRAHRAWLNEGANQDRKRSVQMRALTEFAYPVAPWTDLPPEPLRMLSTEQLQVVFGPQGQTKRLAALFSYLPEVVIPRTTIETVGATNKDVMRRARQAKPLALQEHGLVVLVGTWIEERRLALQLGYDLGDSGWVAIPEARISALGIRPDSFLSRDSGAERP